MINEGNLSGQVKAIKENVTIMAKWKAGFEMSQKEITWRCLDQNEK